MLPNAETIISAYHHVATVSQNLTHTRATVYSNYDTLTQINIVPCRTVKKKTIFCKIHPANGLIRRQPLFHLLDCRILLRHPINVLRTSANFGLSIRFGVLFLYATSTRFHYEYFTIIASINLSLVEPVCSVDVKPCAHKRIGCVELAHEANCWAVFC